MCSAKCTLQSLCIDETNPFVDPTKQTIDGFCCNGAIDWDSCGTLGVQTCAAGSICTENPNNPTDTTLRCVPQIKTNTLWIGVLLSLMGAATINLGLNVQKLAHRKRIEMSENKSASIGSRVARITVSMQNLLSKLSARPISNIKEEEEEIQNDLASSKQIAMLPMGSRRLNSADIGNDHHETGNNRRFSGEISSRNQEAPKDISDLIEITPREDHGSQTSENKLQQKLNFGDLARNTTWILGFFVFLLGNIFNVIALQFAPQSLVAPLGSFSLVVNVIIAPMMNNEKWDYKDILGVGLIVTGSVIVVAFAGSNNHNYCLAVLLYLFSRTPTIIFLTCIAMLLATIFMFIVVVEKNIDYKNDQTSSAVDLEIMNDADLIISVSENTGDNKHERTMTLSPRSDKKFLDHDYDIQDNSKTEYEAEKSTMINTLILDDPEVKSISLVISLDEHKRNLTQTKLNKHSPSTSCESNQVPSTSTISSKKLYSNLMNAMTEHKYFKLIKNLKIIPRFKNKIPFHSVLVRIMLPFCYASLGVYFYSENRG